MSTPVAIPPLCGGGCGSPFSNIFAGVITWFPAPVTFTKMNAILNPQALEILIAVRVTIQAQLYKYTTGFGATAVPGATCTFLMTGSAPVPYTFSDIIPPGQTAQCSSTFSASFNAGEGAYWFVYSTSSTTAGQPLTTSLPVDIVIGIAQ
jgi:hypothetical protein